MVWVLLTQLGQGCTISLVLQASTCHQHHTEANLHFPCMHDEKHISMAVVSYEVPQVSSDDHNSEQYNMPMFCNLHCVVYFVQLTIGSLL